MTDKEQDNPIGRKNPPDSNQKVNVAILATKMDQCIFEIRGFASSLERIEELVLELRDRTIRNETKIENLETKSKNWDIVNSVGAFIAAIIGTFGITNK